MIPTTSMTYLNTRHQLPQIGMNNQLGKFSKTAVNQTQMHGNGHQQAQSHMGITQSQLDIIDYPSRKAYGARNMTDFTAERGQQGIADVQQAISGHAQETWDVIERGPRKGNYQIQKFHQKIFEDKSIRPRFAINSVPDPEIHGQQAQVVGDIDVGDVTEYPEPSTEPNIQFERGNLQTYLDNQGFINRWTSQGQYDIQA